jgi:protein-histidine N-methyltransferase
MSEEDVLEPDVKPSGLDNSDIKTNVYEGGFKTWECSYDLAKLLLDRGPRNDLDDMYRVNHVIEVFCPSLHSVP